MAKKKAEKSLDELLEEALAKEDEQPYEVPGNWAWVKIGSINHRKSGNVDPRKFPSDKFELYSVPSFADSFPEILEGRKIKSSKQAIKEGDILLCKINPRINRVWMVGNNTEHRTIGSSEWIVITPSNEINNEYLLWVLRSNYFRNQLTSNVSGVGGSLTRAKPTNVALYPIPIPPLPEQKRIVKKLSSMLDKLKETRELILEAEETFEERRAAILNKAFTGELTKKWREENPDVESAEKLIEILIDQKKKQGKKGGIPTYEEMIIEEDAQPYNLPGNWEFVRLGKVLQINPLKYKPEIVDDTLCSFVPMKAVSDKLGIIENIEKKPYVKIKNGYTSFKENDVLFAKITPCMENGKAAIAKNLINGFGYGSTEFFVFRCSTIVDNNFLYYLVRAKFFRDLAKPNMTGTVGQRRVPKDYLNNFKFPLPPLAEQKEIARILEKLLDHEDEAKALIDMAEEIDLLEKSILSKASGGKLGKNNPNDEPPIEFLKRSLKKKMNK